jgi:hypothetical protein
VIVNTLHKGDNKDNNNNNNNRTINQDNIKSAEGTCDHGNPTVPLSVLSGEL